MVFDKEETSRFKGSTFHGYVGLPECRLYTKGNNLRENHVQTKPHVEVWQFSFATCFNPFEAYARQIGSLLQVGMKIPKTFESPPSRFSSATSCFILHHWVWCMSECVGGNDSVNVNSQGRAELQGAGVHCGPMLCIILYFRPRYQTVKQHVKNIKINYISPKITQNHPKPHCRW